MKLKDLFEEQHVIEGNITIEPDTTTLVGYRHNGIPIAGSIVKGFFNCSHTNVTSLKGAPSRVDLIFNCANTKIRSLVGAPSYVGGDFFCYDTLITSLVGSPLHIENELDCVETKINSLHNVHKHIKHIGTRFMLSNTIRSHILGVMFIKGLVSIQFYHALPTQRLVEPIINKHLQGDRDIHACQEELLEAGYGAYAKL